MKPTRRILLLTPALAAAQAPPPPATVDIARAALQSNRAAMAKVKLPQSTEPAFSFKP